VGPHGEKWMNDNDIRLIDICRYNNLTIKNGYKQIHIIIYIISIHGHNLTGIWNQ
jgi:hypothetical protein